MNLVGQRVKHSILGPGKVDRFSRPNIFIRFDNQSSPSSFTFPDDFKKVLSFEDSNLQRQVTSMPNVKTDRQVSTPSGRTARNSSSVRSHTGTQMSPGPNTRNAQSTVLVSHKIVKPNTSASGNQARTQSNSLFQKSICSFRGKSIPSSAIIRASLACGNRSFSVIIVTDSKEQDSSNGIYWSDRALSKLIMNAHSNGDRSFQFNDKEYTITGITETAHYGGFMAKRDEIISSGRDKELYVFKQKGIYDDPEKGYELVNTKLYFPDRQLINEVPVYYHEETSVFFMNEESFIPLVRNYGLPGVNLHFTPDADTSTSWTGTFNPESKLKLFGYSVQQADGLSSLQRQRLLSSIIRNGQMTDAEVTSYLELFIHLNTGKASMVNACSSWSEDLRFVRSSFNDMRRHADLSGSSVSSRPRSGKTASTHANASVKRKTSSTSMKKTASASVRNTNQSDRVAAKREYDQLIQQRERLQSELLSATGFFKIFKKKRIRRELQRIDLKLKQ